MAMAMALALALAMAMAMAMAMVPGQVPAASWARFVAIYNTLCIQEHYPGESS